LNAESPAILEESWCCRSRLYSDFGIFRPVH
jgi:hypothetical protein